MNRFKKIIAAIMLLVAVFCTMGFVLLEGEQTGNGSYNGHEYVDLGLPSGTLWATCNIGANASERFGDYFAWGETETKSSYTPDTYKYWIGRKLIKYCNNYDYGYNGFADNLAVLLPSDDVATVAWGNGWCMPTAAQWDELMKNTTNTWKNRNGVRGILFTSKNGNSLFLPAAGSGTWRGDFSWDDDSKGYYWSSSLSTENNTFAWDFHFTVGKYGNFSMGNYSRYYGFSVRPVRSNQ